MKTSKNAFTMIELIFVIVILGILSAVAIPKLMATKTDAQAVKEITNAKQIIQNAGAEYVSQNAFSNYPSSDCFKFETTTDGNLTVSFINDTTDLCKVVKTKNLTDVNGTYQFGGTRIKW